MNTNETLNRWNHTKWTHQIAISWYDGKTIAFGDFCADPIPHAKQAADILAMDKTTASEIITALMDTLSHYMQSNNDLSDERDNMRTELDLLKGGAIEAVRKSEEAAREMTLARAKYAPVIKRLREEGLSWNQIAEMTGINRSTIRQWAK